MSIIDAQQLYKSYGPSTVLGGVTVSLGETERVGLVGLNGAGKSTLARILGGLEAPDSGEVAVRRGARVVYLPQVPRLDPGRTAREEVLAGLAEWQAARARYDQASAALSAGDGDLESLVVAQARASAEVERLGGWELAHRAESMLGHLGITRPDARVGTMSGGEQRRVDLARVLVAAPALAILDEPTNHLDVETVEWLERYLLESRGALLLVTHDRYLLDRAVSRILELDRGVLHSYETGRRAAGQDADRGGEGSEGEPGPAGSYESYLEAKADRLAQEARAEANRQSLLRRELEWLRRQPKARTTKQKARAQRAEEAIARRPAPAVGAVRLSLESVRTGKSILELQGVGVAIDGRTLVDGLDLTLRKGQRVGVIGPNGCGKTSLLRAILGELPLSAGRVAMGQNTRASYLGQLRDDLDEGISILENVAEGRSHLVVGEHAVEARAYLDRFLFPPDKLRQPVSSLSGGERNRVALARMLRQSANLVLLDEPANDLDIPTITALEEMLIDFEGTAMVVTHDRWFLDRVATAILAFEGEGRVVLYEGSYSTYRSLRAEQEAAAAADAAPESREAPAAGSVKRERRRPNKLASLTYAERLELGAIVGAIEAAEQRVATLEARLADPATYRDGGREVATLDAELRVARAEAARLLERWEELETKQLG